MTTTTNWIPWDPYPGITLDRLLIVGAIVREARDGAADDHRPEKFEGPWSLGCRCYERQNGALLWRTQDYSWLQVLSGGEGPAHFVMTIGGHPVRICRGTPDDLPPKYQQISFVEVLAQQSLFSLDEDTQQNPNLGLRIVIENGPDSRPDTIHLVEVDEMTGNATNSFIIPEVSATTTIVTEFAPVVPAEEIPPVNAEPTEEEAAKDEEKDKDKTGSDDN